MDICYVLKFGSILASLLQKCGSVLLLAIFLAACGDRFERAFTEETQEPLINVGTPLRAVAAAAEIRLSWQNSALLNRMDIAAYEVTAIGYAAADLNAQPLGNAARSFSLSEISMTGGLTSLELSAADLEIAGVSPSHYGFTVRAFNARDQLLGVLQFSGTAPRLPFPGAGVSTQPAELALTGVPPDLGSRQLQLRLEVPELSDLDGDGLPDAVDCDADGNGLIEVYNAAEFRALAAALAGDVAYNQTIPGCGTGTAAEDDLSSRCFGYELIAELDPPAAQDRQCCLLEACRN